MAYIASVRIAFGLASLALAAPACNVLGGTCNCPEQSNPPSTTVQLEPAEASPIVAVATDPPCSAQISSLQNSSWISVSSQKAETCRVRAKLANGATYQVDVVFQTADLGCCGNVIQAQSFPVVTKTDAGIDANP